MVDLKKVKEEKFEDYEGKLTSVKKATASGRKVVFTVDDHECEMWFDTAEDAEKFFKDLEIGDKVKIRYNIKHDQLLDRDIWRVVRMSKIEEVLIPAEQLKAQKQKVELTPEQKQFLDVMQSSIETLKIWCDEQLKKINALRGEQ